MKMVPITADSSLYRARLPGPASDPAAAPRPGIQPQDFIDCMGEKLQQIGRGDIWDSCIFSGRKRDAWQSCAAAAVGGGPSGAAIVAAVLRAFDACNEGSVPARPHGIPTQQT
jgi:hypothetical protein